MNATAVKKNDQLTPSSAAKRDSIVRAAARVFMQAGYGAASMDQIASEAGVSKQTVYSHFGAKDALFEEIVSGKCTELLGAAGMPIDEADGPRAVLFESARLFLNVVLSDDSVTLYRIIVAESGRFPELAEAFYRAGPKRASEKLSGFLEVFASQGKLAIEDPTDAALMFFAMLRGDLYQRRILGLRGMPDEAEIDAHARFVSDTFIRAHAPETPRP